ncbi:MAG: hypothetical protein JSR76_02180 [Verrucomicrobia bacterium]|nr:hypothetical protein [Verrucomicrobiota bacterium]
MRFLLIALLCATLHGQEYITSQSKHLESALYQETYLDNQALLDRIPHFFWNDEKVEFVWGIESAPRIRKGGFQTKGSAGIIPYIDYDHTIYVLLSRETWGHDKGSYCALEGAVDAYLLMNGVTINTFLSTMIKEGTEESAHLYRFKTDIILSSPCFSYIYQSHDQYDGFESVYALYQVNTLYTTQHFLNATHPLIHELSKQNLCTWMFQEKDDYQWIKLSELLDFLRDTSGNIHTFTNIFDEKVTLSLRNHFVEALKSESGIRTLSEVLETNAARIMVEEI